MAVLGRTHADIEERDRRLIELAACRAIGADDPETPPRIVRRGGLRTAHPWCRLVNAIQQDAIARGHDFADTSKRAALKQPFRRAVLLSPQQRVLLDGARRALGRKVDQLVRHKGKWPLPESPPLDGDLRPVETQQHQVSTLFASAERLDRQKVIPHDELAYSAVRLAGQKL